MPTWNPLRPANHWNKWLVGVFNWMMNFSQSLHRKWMEITKHPSIFKWLALVFQEYDYHACTWSLKSLSWIGKIRFQARYKPSSYTFIMMKVLVLMITFTRWVPCDWFGKGGGHLSSGLHDTWSGIFDASIISKDNRRTMQVHEPFTPPKCNIAPEKWWLDYDPFLLGQPVTFQGRTVQLREGIHIWFLGFTKVKSCKLPGAVPLAEQISTQILKGEEMPLEDLYVSRFELEIWFFYLWCACWYIPFGSGL